MSQAVNPVIQIMILAEFIQCTFFGIHLIAFAATIQSVASSHPEISWTSRFKRRRFTLIVAFLIFALASSHLILGLFAVLSFVAHGCTGIGTGAGEELGPDFLLGIVKTILFQIQTDIADCILIYRCWIVCNKSLRIVIMPITFYLGLVVTSIMIIFTEFKTQGDTASRINGTQSLLHLAAGFWVSTISTNIYASSVIVLRILQVERKSRGKNTLISLYVTHHPSRLQTAMKAVIESGLMYTTISIVTFLTHITGSNSVYITTSMSIQIVGIAFNLGLIRVNQSYRSSTVMTTNVGLTAIEFSPSIT